MDSRNLAMAKNFLEILYGRVEQGFIELRLIHNALPHGQNSHKLYRPLPLGDISDAGLQRIAAQNQQGWNVYFQVAVEKHGNAGKHGKQDVAAITALWLDIDKPSATDVDALMSSPYAPTLLVASGGQHEGRAKVHAYFLLEEAMQVTPDMLPRIERTLDGLALAFNGDRVCKNINRILRVPGFYNVKPEYATPRLCEIISAWDNDKLRPFSAFEAEFAPLGAMPTPTLKREVPALAIDARLPRYVQDYLTSSTPEGQRNARLYAAACGYRDAGRTLNEALNDLGMKAASDGLGATEINRTIESAYAGTANYKLPAHLQQVAIAEDAAL